MHTPTLYLDCIILAAVSYPSGFSNSLFNTWKGAQREVSTAFLGVLALPYIAVAPAIWAVRSALITFHGTTVPLLAVAALLAPLALLIEYGVHGFASYRMTGKFPRGISVQRFWNQRLTIIDQLLLALVVVGEEVFYRVIWLGVLYHSFGLPAWLALGVSSLAYGINHIVFGTTSLVSKTVTGLLYGALYLLGGECIWLPIIAHGLQNIILFKVAKEGHA